MTALAITSRKLLRLFTSQRLLWLPFLVAALTEAVLLGLLWLAPQPPFSALLAPPLRYVAGERILHYPWHPLFLYQVMPRAHAVATVVVGAFLSGLACVMVRQTHDGVPLSFRRALGGGRVRYGTVTLVWLSAWLAARGVMTLLVRTAPAAAWRPPLAAALSLLLQALFVYAIPAAVFDGTGWLGSLRRGLDETLRHPVSTFAMLLVPGVAVLLPAFLVSDGRVAQWLLRTSPDLVALPIAGRLALWTTADAVLTVGVAHLWWVHRRPAAVAPPVAAGIRPAAEAPVPLRQGIAAAVVLLAAASCLCGCEASYDGERMLWKARQVSAPFERDLAAASPAQTTQMVEAFGRVIRRAPGTIWAARAQFAIASIRAARHEDDRAREGYALVTRNYGQYEPVCLRARLAIAQLEETGGRWEAAAKAYQELAAFHPLSGPGLMAPLHVAAGFERRHDAEQAAASYRDAAETYARLLPRAPTAALSNRIKSLLAMADQRLGKWQDAARLLEELAQAADGVNKAYVYLSLGTIYQTQLGDAAAAERWYARLLAEFPDSQLAGIAQAQLTHAAMPPVASLQPAPMVPSGVAQ